VNISPATCIAATGRAELWPPGADTPERLSAA
jgi:hypothetical protein